MKTSTLILMALLVGVALLATGCGYTSYYVKRDDGTELRVLSTREFKDGVSVEYESAQGSKLKVNAGSVTTRESSLQDGLLELLLRQRQTPAPAEDSQQ